MNQKLVHGIFMFIPCILVNYFFFYYYTNICTNKWCKTNGKITATCFGVNTDGVLTPKHVGVTLVINQLDAQNLVL